MNKLVSRVAALCMLVLGLVALSGCEEATYYYTIAPAETPNENPTTEQPASNPDVIFENMLGTEAQFVVPGQRELKLASLRVLRKSSNTNLGVSQLVFDTGVEGIPSWMLFSNLVIKADGLKISEYYYTRYSSDGLLIVDFNNAWHPQGMKEYTFEQNIPAAAPSGTKFQFKLVAVVLDEYGLEVANNVVGPAYGIHDVVGFQLPTVTSSSYPWASDLTTDEFIYMGSFIVECPMSATSCTFEGVDAYIGNSNGAYMSTVFYSELPQPVSPWIAADQGSQGGFNTFSSDLGMRPGDRLSVSFGAYVGQSSYLMLEVSQVKMNVDGYKVNALPVVNNICDTILRSMDDRMSCKG